MVPWTNSAKEKENSDHSVSSQTARKARGNHLGYLPRQGINYDIQKLLYSRKLKRERERERMRDLYHATTILNDLLNSSLLSKESHYWNSSNMHSAIDHCN